MYFFIWVSFFIKIFEISNTDADLSFKMAATTETYLIPTDWKYATTTHLCYGYNRWGWDSRGHDRMVVGFTTTYAISAYHR